MSKKKETKTAEETEAMMPEVETASTIKETTEAPVAEFFGLAELRRRARKVVAARDKARRRLAMAGVSRKVKGPVSFRIVKRKLPLMEGTMPASGIQSQDSVIYRV